MESSTQHEEHSGRAVTDCGPSFSNTNVSGAKHTCQSCGITASGSKPNPSSSANTASGQSPTFSSGSETANPSVRGPELVFSGHEDAPRGVNTTSSIPSGVNAASPIHSGVNAASLIHSGANTANPTSSPNGPEPSRFVGTNSANPGDSNAAAPQTAPAPRVRRTYLEIMTETPESTARGLAAFREEMANTPSAQLRADAVFRMILDGPSDQDPEAPPEGESRESLE